MLTKDLLRVSRAGGGYRPQFAGREHRPLAARVLGTYQGHVGRARSELDAALADLEGEADHFKLVRGFAKLLDREAAFETRAAVPPERARRVAFEAAERVGVVSEAERDEALRRAGDRLAADSGEIAESLYADLDERQVLAEFEARWNPDQLLAQYNLSLAQTALFDATELRVRTSDPKALVSAVKRLRLMYEIRKTEGDRGTSLSDREVVVTGPDALFRSTRRYGTRFARLLRTVAKADSWTLSATVDDYGTERTLTLSDDDPVRVPGVEPVADVTFDSGVEADFAARFESLDLDWALTREPEPLETGARVMIPDFAFDYLPASVASGGSSDESDGEHADFRVFFEIMGFWTPEYVEKKLSQLESVEDVELVVAVDESLGVGEEIAARDHRAIPYSGTIRLKDVRDALRRYEAQLVAESAADLPDEIVPEPDVISLEALASERGVSEDAIEGVAFPDHERVGRTLVRPEVLAELADDIEAGMAFSEAETVLDERGVGDASAVLSELGYAVEWEGLSGGTVRRTDARGEE
jgi:predicted nuclease of restriction endonuclease-like RecB superfamily